MSGSGVGCGDVSGCSGDGVCVVIVVDVVALMFVVVLV